MICNPSKNNNEPKQLYNKSNDSKIRMVQEAARHGLLRDGNVPVMRDFNYKERD